MARRAADRPSFFVPALAQQDPTPVTRKVFIKTYGCQMNVYDSERMAEALGTDGYVATGDASEADMILLNTCHIREKAAEKVYSELGRYKGLKAEMGEEFSAAFLKLKQQEWDDFVSHFSRWEKENTLDI